DEAARHFFGIAGIDLGTRAAGGAEGDAAELQPRRSRPGALLDKIEREALGLGVAVLFQHFEPIDDGASRADKIVTAARAQQRSEVERFEGDLAGHGLVSGSVGLTWEPAGAPNRGRGVGAAV